MNFGELREKAKARIAEFKETFERERELLRQERERFDKPVYDEESDPFRKDKYQGDQFDGELEVWYCSKCGVRAVRHPGQPNPSADEISEVDVCPNAEDHAWVPANAWLAEKGRHGAINQRQFFRKKQP